MVVLPDKNFFKGCMSSPLFIKNQKKKKKEENINLNKDNLFLDRTVGKLAHFPSELPHSL